MSNPADQEVSASIQNASAYFLQMNKDGLPDGCNVIWEKVFFTPPEFTTAFTRGGFDGVAIAPQFMVMNATQMFGPIGLGWGFTVSDDQIIDGAPIVSPAGAVICVEKIHRVKVKLWYNKIDGGQKRSGFVEQFGATKYVYRDASGDVTSNEDAFKSSVTDGMTKCLSLLGFSGDVYMNLHKDSKYREFLSSQAGRDKVQALPAGTRELLAKTAGGADRQSQGSIPQERPAATNGGHTKPKAPETFAEIEAAFRARSGLTQTCLDILTRFSEGKVSADPEKVRMGILAEKNITDFERSYLLARPEISNTSNPSAGRAQLL